MTRNRDMVSFFLPQELIVALKKKGFSPTHLINIVLMEESEAKELLEIQKNSKRRMSINVTVEPSLVRRMDKMTDNRSEMMRGKIEEFLTKMATSKRRR